MWAKEANFTMFESPRSLQEVCLDFICDNVLALCEVHPGDNGGSLSENAISVGKNDLR